MEEASPDLEMRGARREVLIPAKGMDRRTEKQRRGLFRRNPRKRIEGRTQETGKAGRKLRNLHGKKTERKTSTVAGINREIMEGGSALLRRRRRRREGINGETKEAMEKTTSVD
ncbi:hypothetical protein BT93_B2266 [Corymbia citriodora subsp. variegata]|nr:hypothetical protein BT93_B2266 [Corymbia citriodora subsp. variegata]